MDVDFMLSDSLEVRYTICIMSFLNLDSGGKTKTQMCDDFRRGCSGSRRSVELSLPGRR